MAAIVARNKTEAARLRKLLNRPREEKPKKPAKKKPPATGPRERDVVRSVLAYLDDAGVVAWRNNAGRFTNAQGRSFAMAPTGSADVLGCLPGTGRLLCVECKRPRGGKTTDAQNDWLARMTRQGALCVVARSARDVYQALKLAGYAAPEPRGILL